VVADVSGTAGGSSDSSDGGTVYVGSYCSYSTCWDGEVHALDAETGDVQWEEEVSGGVESSDPAVVDGTVYVGGVSRDVWALDASDGSVQWQYETAGRVNSSPAVAGDTLYVGSDDGYLYAIRVA
jgi:outer membrane protein assembly factor BamB